MNFYALFLLISKLLQLLLELLRKEMLKQTISSPSKPRKTSRTSWIKKNLHNKGFNGYPNLHLAGILIFLPGTGSLQKSAAHCRQHKYCSWSCEACRLLVMLWMHKTWNAWAGNCPGWVTCVFNMDAVVTNFVCVVQGSATNGDNKKDNLCYFPVEFFCSEHCALLICVLGSYSFQKRKT